MKAIPGTGGILTVIANRLGCSYHSLYEVLKKKEGDKWDEVRYLLQMEREKVGDIAESTVIEMMGQRLDLSVASSTSKWFLSSKHADRGYVDRKQVTLNGGQNPLHVRMETTVPIEKLDLPTEVKIQVLEAIERWELQNKGKTN